MGITVRLSGAAKLVSDLRAAATRLSAGAKVVGSRNTAFALVWEWGSARINPGPKTLLSTNPAGEVRVLTTTAPHGYIRVNRQYYIQFLQEEVNKTDWSKVPLSEVSKYAAICLNAAVERCAALISETAPIDEGILRASIKPAYVGDSSLQQPSEALEL